MKGDTLYAEDADTASRAVCRHIVRSLIAKYGWTLLSEDDLIKSMLDLMDPEMTPAQITRLDKHHYTTALYKACRQSEDPERRERGYRELHHQLFRTASRRWPGLAEDVTQRALVLVYEQIDCCRNPGTFLAFALYKLLDAFQREQRARGNELYLNQVHQGNARGTTPTTLQSHLDRQERVQELLNAIKRIPSEQQQKAILLKFFGGFSDGEISTRLGVTTGNVRVLRHRGLRLLQGDERLRDYLNEETGH